MVLVCMEGFLMPVQCVFRPGIEDLLWYLDVISGELPGALNQVVSKACHPSFSVSKVRWRSTPVPAPCSGRSELSESDTRWLKDSRGCWWGGMSELQAFPVKKEAPTEKINLWFRDVWHDVRRSFPDQAIVFEACSMGKSLRNDEATSWLLWLVATAGPLRGVQGGTLQYFSGDRARCKALTTLIKGLGLQSAPDFAALCEMDTMAGRGVHIPTAWSDIRTRVDKKAFLAEKGVTVDEASLRKALRSVIAGEMSSKPTWGDPDAYWSRRWLFTKAGAHSGYAEKNWRADRLPLPERPSRREFAEAQVESVVALGHPRVDAGLSWKLEHGKTRAIYSCDSRSYFTFDYLLKPVEAVWRNRRVLLDPGREPQSLFYRRLATEGPCRFMLDFDDFNSQHTLDSMRICIEEACAGAPKEVLDWASHSWHNMHVHWPDRSGMREETMCGTLPSGHRATTFVNTLLNAAYCKIVAGDDFDVLWSRHTGDDVVFSGPQEACSRVAAAFAASPFRANRMKQSIGEKSGEFLRVCYDDHGARGYVARAVASLVSGNWVTESRVSPRSYAENLIRASWNVAARGSASAFGLALVSSLSRWVPQLTAFALPLLTHSMSLEGTPVSIGRVADRVEVLRIDGGTQKFTRPRRVFTAATDDFLKNHMDFEILKEAEVRIGEVRSAMLSASYKPRGVVSTTPLRLGVTEAVELVAHDQPSTFRHLARAGKGEVEALALLRSLYDTIDWRFIVAKVRGGDASAMSTEGKMEWPVQSSYAMPFSDCMRARSILTRPGYFINEYPVRV